MSAGDDIDYFEAVHRSLIRYLADRYRKSTNEACEIAGLCDELLDQSGRLLGEVRAAARLARIPEGQPVR